MIGKLQQKVQHFQQMNNDGAEGGQWAFIVFETLGILGAFMAYLKKNKNSQDEIYARLRADALKRESMVKGGAKSEPETIPLKEKDG